MYLSKIFWFRVLFWLYSDTRNIVLFKRFHTKLCFFSQEQKKSAFMNKFPMQKKRPPIWNPAQFNTLQQITNSNKAGITAHSIYLTSKCMVVFSCHTESKKKLDLHKKTTTTKCRLLGNHWGQSRLNSWLFALRESRVWRGLTFTTGEADKVPNRRIINLQPLWSMTSKFLVVCIRREPGLKQAWPSQQVKQTKYQIE